MPGYVNLLITLSVGAALGYGLMKAKMPGGMLIGAMLGAALLSMFTDIGYMPRLGKVIAQTCSGAFIACSFHGRDLRHLPKIILPAIIAICGFFLLNLASGWLLYNGSQLDIVTAYMSVTPGGLTDTPIIAMDWGGNAAIVTVIQTMRLLIGILVMPVLALALTRKEAQPGAGDRQFQKPAHASRLNLALTIVVAGVGGWLGTWAGVPAGALLFSLLLVLLLNIFFHRAYMPLPLRRATQALAGCYIGCSAMISDLDLIRRSLPAIALALAVFVVGCTTMAFIIHKTCHMTLREAMLVSSPAGASDLALIAADMGVPASDVGIIQICRLLSVVTIFPQLLNWLIFT